MARVKKQETGDEWILYVFFNVTLLALEYPLINDSSSLGGLMLFFYFMLGAVLEVANIIFVFSYIASHKGQKNSQVRNLIEGVIAIFLLFSFFIPFIIAYISQIVRVLG